MVRRRYYGINMVRQQVPMRQVLSPNFDRLGLTKKTAVVLHGTLGSYEGSVSWLSDPKSQVSAHVCISKKGDITELVLPQFRAWHAGRVSNPTKEAKEFFNGTNPNNVSLGIEFEHYQGETGADVTKEQLNTLTAYLEKCKLDGFLVENPRFFVHSEITDYKYDFKKDGKIDRTIIEKLTAPSKESIKKQIIELLNQL